MEIISMIVVVSIIACVILIGVATIRLIQAENEPNPIQLRPSELKSTSLPTAPSNDVVYAEGRISLVTELRPMKAKS